MSETLTTTRPGHHVPPIELNNFKDIELCVEAYLKRLIKMTAPFRNAGTNQLLLSFVQPHTPVSTLGFSRLCVAVMKESGFCQNHSARYLGYCSNKL